MSAAEIPSRIGYQRLLEITPRIAEAVNQFTDPRIQRAAFVVLLEALGVDVDEEMLVHAEAETE